VRSIDGQRPLADSAASAAIAVAEPASGEAGLSENEAAETMTRRTSLPEIVLIAQGMLRRRVTDCA
jgi:hypothetical protein